MFTGLIEELGTVKGIRHGPKSAKLDIQATEVLKDVQVGDSIAVNGVCLTVTDFDSTHFTADVMAETINRTNLKWLKAKDHVNLERAMRMGGRLGGHLVSGHVDQVGTIIKQEQVDIAQVTWIETSSDALRFLIPKGSVAIDGISLTVVEVEADSFSVSLIPHTAKATTLGIKGVGDNINIETDMLAKYVARLLSWDETNNKEQSITEAFLAENGFV